MHDNPIEKEESRIPFRNTLFEQFAQPVLQSLSDNAGALIIRKPLDSFLIPLKLCLFVSFIFSLPWTLYQIWGFVAPGLYRRERKIIAPLIISTTGLASSTPDGASYGPDIADYFSFVFTVFFAFGLAFEVRINGVGGGHRC